MMNKILYTVFSQYERKSSLENQTAFRQDYEPFENSAIDVLHTMWMCLKIITNKTLTFLFAAVVVEQIISIWTQGRKIFFIIGYC